MIITTELLVFLIGFTNANEHRLLSFFDPKTVDSKDVKLIPSRTKDQEEKSTNLRNNIPTTNIAANSSSLETELATKQINPSRGYLPPPSDKKHLIPPALENLADLSDIYTRDNKEVPFFWHIAKGGGSTIKHLYSDCFGLVEATENGILEGHQNDMSLEVVTLQVLNGWKFVNVDTTIPSGIDRAAKLNTAKSGLVDLLISPLPYEVVPKLFDSDHKGRFFTIFRDPLERVVSIFYYLQQATYEPTYNPKLASMTFEEYVFSDLAESNFITRSLIDKMEEAFVEEDFWIAREILKTKCLVGLLDQMEESVRRFDSYFGFRNIDKEVSEDCVEGYLKKGVNKNVHPNLPPEYTAVYKELVRKNHMDIRLHKYAIELFQEQKKMFENTDSDDTF